MLDRRQRVRSVEEDRSFRKLLEENAIVGLEVMRVVARVYFSPYIETLSRFQHLVDDLALTT